MKKTKEGREGTVLGTAKVGFDVVSNKKESQLSDAFYWIQKYRFKPKLLLFGIVKIQVHTVLQ